MAIACFRLFTFFPLRPLFSRPRFISCISSCTFLPAEGEYFREDFFFDEVLFLEDDFFAEDRVLFLLEVDFLLDVDLREEEDFFRDEDFFLLDFLVAIRISSRGSDGNQNGAGCIAHLF